MSSQKEPTIRDIKVTDLASLTEKRKATGAFNDGGISATPGTRVGGHNIVTISVDHEQKVSSFEPESLSKKGGVRYSEAMRGASNLDNQKNTRFRLNELTRGPLSVEAEEEVRIESEVERRLAIKLEAIREKTRLEAHQEGLDKGRVDARTEILAEYKPVIERFESLLATLDGAREEVFKANEDFLIKLVHRLAKHVLLRELKEDVDYTKRLVTQLLERIGTKENIKIFLGESEIYSAEALKGSLAQSMGQLKNITVELDSNITSRGCRIETEFGDIDARLEVQIENLAQVLGVETKTS